MILLRWWHIWVLLPELQHLIMWVFKSVVYTFKVLCIIVFVLLPTPEITIVQADKVHIQSKNSGYDGRNIRRSYVQEEVIEGNNVQNDAGNIQRTLRTTSSGTAANVQC
ncbi:hypothetical protein Tco_1441730 [Tanacetum coccineum]